MGAISSGYAAGMAGGGKYTPLAQGLSQLVQILQAKAAETRGFAQKKELTEIGERGATGRTAIAAGYQPPEGYMAEQGMAGWGTPAPEAPSFSEVGAKRQAMADLIRGEVVVLTEWGKESLPIETPDDARAAVLFRKADPDDPEIQMLMAKYIEKPQTSKTPAKKRPGLLKKMFGSRARKTGRMHVRLKSNGETGTIEAQEFDPTIYEEM